MGDDREVELRTAASHPVDFETCVASRIAVTLIALLVAGSGRAAGVSVQVRTPEGRAAEGFVVTLAPEAGEARRPAPIKAVMDQFDRSFSPPVLVVPVGSTVTFPNSDTVSHQVYSFSPARRFQLPLYRGTPYPPVRFDEPGVVTLGCNIHDDMIAYVVVTAAPYFGTTDRAGNWSTMDVAAGRYRVSLWHPRLPGATHTVEQQLVVERTGTATVGFRVDGAGRTVFSPPKPRTWDAY